MRRFVSTLPSFPARATAQFAGIVVLGAGLMLAGCKKDAPESKTAADKPAPTEPAAATPGAAASASNKVDWDEPNAKGTAKAAPASDNDLADAWPIPGPVDASEFARGGQKKVDEIRQELSRYEGVFLQGWAEVLNKEGAPADEVQAALTELMSAVTGPGGLWNKLPDQWFGCAANADSAPCQAFAKVRPHFEEWEKFQSKLDSAPKSARFLARSHGKIMKYFKAYVPTARSLTSVQQTEFFRENIAKAL